MHRAIQYAGSLRITALPVRLRPCLPLVKAAGGKVTLTPPTSEFTAKDPALRLPLISAPMPDSQIAKQVALQNQCARAHADDAEVVRVDDGNGQSILSHLVFARRAP